VDTAPREYDSLMIALEAGDGLKRQPIAEDDGVTLDTSVAS